MRPLWWSCFDRLLGGSEAWSLMVGLCAHFLFFSPCKKKKLRLVGRKLLSNVIAAIIAFLAAVIVFLAAAFFLATVIVFLAAVIDF